MTEDEMAGWCHRLNGHEFEQALGVSDGQGSPACCSPWGHKESKVTEQLNLCIQGIYLYIYLKYRFFYMRLNVHRRLFTNAKTQK